MSNVSSDNHVETLEENLLQYLYFYYFTSNIFIVIIITDQCNDFSILICLPEVTG